MVTITVLMILGTVSINVALGENGIIRKQREMRTAYSDAVETKEADLDRVLELYNNEMTVVPEVPEIPEGGIHTPISKSHSFVGYYADIEGDGVVDGVIYADLLRGNTGSGQLFSTDGNYTIQSIESSKNYYVIQEDYAGNFGTSSVLAPMGEGAERFYIMALNNVSGFEYYWYYNAYDEHISNYNKRTKTEFGEGRANTTTILTMWNGNTYGIKASSANPINNAMDLWGAIETQVENGWFVPSKEEWLAFGGELGVTNSNYAEYGLLENYWSSSLGYSFRAWSIMWDGMANSNINAFRHLRLSTIF